jgi:type IV secretory pathway TraG/TraD family ATPase VirD4
MLGKIQDLETHILTSRGRKLSISLISNSFSNLEKIYGDEIYTMLNTIDTQMLLGTNIQSDIDYFSQILGVDENEIRTLDRDKLLIFEKGLKAILAEKDYFFNHDEWK